MITYLSQGEYTHNMRMLQVIKLPVKINPNYKLSSTANVKMKAELTPIRAQGRIRAKYFNSGVWYYV